MMRPWVLTQRTLISGFLMPSTNPSDSPLSDTYSTVGVGSNYQTQQLLFLLTVIIISAQWQLPLALDSFTGCYGHEIFKYRLCYHTITARQPKDSFNGLLFELKVLLRRKETVRCILLGSPKICE